MIMAGDLRDMVDMVGDEGDGRNRRGVNLVPRGHDGVALNRLADEQ